MPSPFDDICCARIPVDALPRLASLRVEPGLRAALTVEHAWLRWEAGNEHVVELVMPIHDAVLFRFHEGRWHRFGESLPAFDFPSDLNYQPLAHVLFPAAVQPISPPKRIRQPVQLALAREDRPRTTSALLCPIRVLCEWSDTIPTSRLESIVGLRLGEEALLVGENLPLLDGQRYWGRDVLIPLGYAPVPSLPESALREAAGLQEDELLLWRVEQADVIDRTLLSPLTRAALRIADGRDELNRT
jgi:uncharacterized membrane protein